MATAAYTDRRHARHVSLSKLTVIAANFAMWASLIAGFVLVAR